MVGKQVVWIVFTTQRPHIPEAGGDCNITSGVTLSVTMTMLISSLTLALMVTMAASLELYQMEFQAPVQCRDNETYNSVALTCEACGPGTQVSRETGECQCQEGWVIIRSGAALECQQCPQGQEATSGEDHFIKWVTVFSK